ncbi:helix-turn-helix transcriptional regulator [Vibrio sp. 1F255]
MNDKRFPGQMFLGCRSVAWGESEIDDWFEQRIASR